MHTYIYIFIYMCVCIQGVVVKNGNGNGWYHLVLDPEEVQGAVGHDEPDDIDAVYAPEDNQPLAPGTVRQDRSHFVVVGDVHDLALRHVHDGALGFQWGGGYCGGAGGTQTMGKHCQVCWPLACECGAGGSECGARGSNATDTGSNATDTARVCNARGTAPRGKPSRRVKAAPAKDTSSEARRREAASEAASEATPNDMNMTTLEARNKGRSYVRNKGPNKGPTSTKRTIVDAQEEEEESGHREATMGWRRGSRSKALLHTVDSPATSTHMHDAQVSMLRSTPSHVEHLSTVRHAIHVALHPHSLCAEEQEEEEACNKKGAHEQQVPRRALSGTSEKMQDLPLSWSCWSLQDDNKQNDDNEGTMEDVESGSVVQDVESGRSMQDQEAQWSRHWDASLCLAAERAAAAHHEQVNLSGDGRSGGKTWSVDGGNTCSDINTTAHANGMAGNAQSNHLRTTSAQGKKRVLKQPKLLGPSVGLAVALAAAGAPVGVPPTLAASTASAVWARDTARDTARDAASAAPAGCLVECGAHIECGAHTNVRQQARHQQTHQHAPSTSPTPTSSTLTPPSTPHSTNAYAREIAAGRVPVMGAHTASGANGDIESDTAGWYHQGCQDKDQRQDKDQDQEKEEDAYQAKHQEALAADAPPRHTADEHRGRGGRALSPRQRPLQNKVQTPNKAEAATVGPHDLDARDAREQYIPAQGEGAEKGEGGQRDSADFREQAQQRQRVDKRRRGEGAEKREAGEKRQRGERGERKRVAEDAKDDVDIYAKLDVCSKNDGTRNDARPNHLVPAKRHRRKEEEETKKKKGNTKGKVAAKERVAAKQKVASKQKVAAKDMAVQVRADDVGVHVRSDASPRAHEVVVVDDDEDDEEEEEEKEKKAEEDTEVDYFNPNTATHIEDTQKRHRDAGLAHAQTGRWCTLLCFATLLCYLFDSFLCQIMIMPLSCCLSARYVTWLIDM